MLITVHDSKLNQVAVLDNSKQSTLNYTDDEWHRYLETGSSIYNLTVYKKRLASDKNGKYAFQHLKVGAFLSFRYQKKDYLFKIMHVKEDDEVLTVESEALNLELLNEYARAYTAEKAMTLAEYLKTLNIVNINNNLQIGKNEVADKKITLKWEAEETKLNRLISIAQNFDAEHEFEIELTDAGKVKNFKVNFYKENDGDKSQGVGKLREDVILQDGVNVDFVNKTEDITELFNMTRPKGKKKITKTRVVKNAVTKTTTVAANQKYTGGAIRYANGSLSVAHVQEILTLCVKHSLLPSGVICQLYLESFWGNSAVGRADNNWSGMTGGAGVRPSGVRVSTGTSRPAAEGGTYMRYASVSDFLKDYTYLLAEQKAGNGAKFYGVKGKNNITDYTKGLFRIGGALYDYAAAGYNHYISLMVSIQRGVNQNNGDVLTKLDAQWKKPVTPVTTTSSGKGAPNAKRVLTQLGSLLNRTLGNGQCYAVAAWYAQQLGGPGLGAGINAISGLRGGGIAAAYIGTDYAWGNYKWSVEGQPITAAKVRAGGIANIRPNYGSPFWTGVYGHTVVIEKVSGNTITVLEQNYAGKQSVTRNSYNLQAYMGGILTICYPPEIAAGGAIDAQASTQTTITNADGTTQIVEVVTPEEIEITEEEVDLFISNDTKKEYKNAAGQVEYKVENGFVFSPLSKDLYPAVFTGEEVNDNYIRRDFEYEIDTEERLISESIEKLKKYAFPQVEYEVEGYFEGSIGDTFLIESGNFYPKLALKARISEQVISFADSRNNKTVFSNYKKLDLRTSNDLLSEMYRMVEDSKPYEITLFTNNGVVFKNNEGESVLTATVSKSGVEEEDAIFMFKNGDSLIGMGKQLTVKATDFDRILNVTIEAYLRNELIAGGQVSFSKTFDGEAQFTHIAYANKAEDGSIIDFSLTETTDREWLGTLTDNNREASTDPNLYTWVKVRGPKGALDEEQVAEMNDKIDSKADAQLTIQQLNALYEAQTLAKAEMEAKASIDTVDQWITAYIDFVSANEEDKARAEQNLIAASQRITMIETDIGDMAARLNFIDIFMRASEEGLIIGRNDGSASIKIAEDRISMFSAGSEVMYISQGVIHIENGIFSKTVQIGRFREEQYHLNPDMNVIRYVGGLV
ncbi:glucosaminidase domain-containing protein [Streptococcus sp. H49]|uniref:glucosaminidase domain-containing protein n=1 Tax=Streptococcus huangxiaojuni TaxID=3237239 RepID=UPI0034A37D19